MPDQLTDFRDHLVHRLVRFTTIDFPLEPMPKPFDGIILRAVRRQMLELQPPHFGHKRLHFLALMDAAIIQNQHQQLIRKTLMELMEEGDKSAGIAPGRLFPINPLTLKV